MSHKPVVREPNYTAVILVSSAVVLHAGVNHMSDWLVDVVRTHVLQEVHHLTTSRLKTGKYKAVCDYTMVNFHKNTHKSSNLVQLWVGVLIILVIDDLHISYEIAIRWM